MKLEDMCLPKEKGGIGFKSLHNMSNALFCKLWWHVRVRPTIWSSYIINKYYKKLHPIIATSRGASQTWKRLLTFRELVEHQILWQIRSRDTSFWLEHWTSLGDPYYVLPNVLKDEEIEVKQFADSQGWRVDLLSQYLPDDIVHHISTTIIPPNDKEKLGKSVWMLEYSGNFSVKSVCHYIRHREENKDIYKNI